jgi:tetrachloro-p-hydroquinone reductive dehalogenase
MMRALRLYHAASSYYSMIARLAFVERELTFEGMIVDIHRRRAHFEPSYVRLNPNMTVPTFVDGERVLSDSRDILLFAFDKTMETLDDDAARWLAAHYAFPIDELTFGWLLGWNALARYAVPRSLARAEARLRDLFARPSFKAADVWTRIKLVPMVRQIL